jgi:hypothetical protein
MLILKNVDFLNFVESLMNSKDPDPELDSDPY